MKENRQEREQNNLCRSFSPELQKLFSETAEKSEIKYTLKSQTSIKAFNAILLGRSAFSLVLM